MPFQESVEGIPNNTNSNISLPGSKRKISIDPAAESALPSINENAEPTKFNQIIKPNSIPSRFFFIVRSTFDAFPKVEFSQSNCSTFLWLAYKYPKETFNESYKNNRNVFTTDFI